MQLLLQRAVVFVHRPAVVPAPGFALRLLYGEMASIVTASQRMVPRRALELGYEFAFPSRTLYVDTIGLPLENRGDGDYYASERVRGCRHVGVWPLSEAGKKSCPSHGTSIMETRQPMKNNETNKARW